MVCRRRIVGCKQEIMKGLVGIEVMLRSEPKKPWGLKLADVDIDD
jgi:hypothetical protein